MYWIIAFVMLIFYVIERRAADWRETKLDAEMKRIREQIAARENDAAH